MKNKSLNKLRLFPALFFVFLNSILAVNTPKVIVEIEPKVFELLHTKKKSEILFAEKIIKDNIKKAYNQAFQRFDSKKNDIKNEAGKDLKCIVNAIDSYRNSLSDFSIYFTFSEAYKKYLKSKNMDVYTFPGDRDGEGSPIFKGGKEPGITIKNVFMRNNYYKKFVTNYNECQFNAFLQCILDENRSILKIKKESYTGRKIKNFYSPEDSKYKWKKQGSIKGTLKCIIFHEFLHQALLYSNDKVAESRGRDEATIEDFVSKIFSQEDVFIGPYLCEMKVEKQEKRKFNRNQNEKNDYLLY